MIRGVTFTLLVATMPVAAATHSAGRRAEQAFFDIGTALARGVRALGDFVPRGAERAAVSSSLEDAPLPEASSAEAPKPAPRSRSRRGRAEKSEISVHVSEQKIVELARIQAVPRGESVPEKGTRPAGIALFGVGRLGLGLRDGDVLTAVEGHPVQAEGQVVGVIVGVLARQARRITGEFWRGDRRGIIVVDLPIVRMNP